MIRGAGSEDICEEACSGHREWHRITAVCTQGIQECNRTTRAFIGHGRMDQMVPTMLASSTQERLQEERIPNEMTVYEGLEHSVSMEEVNDVLAFIRSVLGDTPAKL